MGGRYRTPRADEIPVWYIDSIIRQSFAAHPHAFVCGCGKETLAMWVRSATGCPWYGRRLMRGIMRRAEEHGIVRRTTKRPAIARYELVQPVTGVDL